MAPGPGSPPQAELETEERRPWVLLAAVPRILTTPRLPLAGERGKDAVDVELALEKPPRIAFLRVGRHVVPRNEDITPGFHHPFLSDPAPSSGRYPYIAAVESSGAMLLCASHRANRDLSPYPNWPRFVLCDSIRGTAVDLPVLEKDRLLFSLDHPGPGRVGLLRDAAGRLMVAELQPVPLGDVGYNPSSATLFRLFEGTEKWEMKRITRPPRHDDFSWAYDGVVEHAGRLWWVDLSYGILSCDPFAEQPEVVHIPLPPGCAPPSAATRRRLQIDLDKSRCVRRSGGKLRFLIIKEDGGAPAIQMWSLCADADGRYHWSSDYSTPLTSVLGDEVLQRAGVPVLAGVDPFDPKIVFMWLGGGIFGFDVPAKKLLHSGEPFSAPDHDIPKGEFPSSRFLHAWVLPASLHQQFHGHGSGLSILRAILNWLGNVEQH